MTKKNLSVGLLIIVGMILSSCVTSKAPARTNYVGHDIISNANINCLIGSWLAQEINPIDNQLQQDTLIEYQSDGTVTGTVGLAVGSETIQNPNAFHVQITGSWSLQNDLITHSDIKMESLNDDPTSLLLSELINNAGHELGGTANIYELTADKMVTVGTDGKAIQYVRQSEADTDTDTESDTCQLPTE